VIEIFAEHRSLLFGIAYRMLGRITEAEDMVQETWLRWQRQNLADIRSPRAWLVAAVTRLCLDQLRSAKHQREEYYGVWLPEPLIDSAGAGDQTGALADSLTTAFMVMLELLSPTERAVFLLRNVFDYDYPEIASIMNKSEANCRQIFRRAKTRLVQSNKSSVTPNQHAERIVQQFLVAQKTGSVSDLLALLTEDAVLYADGGGRVAAAGRPIHGANQISRFFVGIRRQIPANLELRITPMSGSIGVLAIIDQEIIQAMTFDIFEDRISAIYVVRNPDKLRHFGNAERGLRSAE
jgi:RNA polymerase sigma-70 factor (ECF subfamily)